MPKIVDHDERREEYLDAMWRVVSRDGAGGISVRSVAAEAGVSPSNIVHYLPSRGDMLGEAVRRLMDEVLGRVSRIDATQLTIATMTDMVMLAIPSTKTRRRQSEVWLLLLAEQEVSPEARRILGELQDRVAVATRTGIDQMAECGLFAHGRDRDLEARRLHALIDGLSVQSLINPMAMSSSMIRAIVHAHVAELGTEPS